MTGRIPTDLDVKLSRKQKEMKRRREEAHADHGASQMNLSSNSIERRGRKEMMPRIKQDKKLPDLGITDHQGNYISYTGHKIGDYALVD